MKYYNQLIQKLDQFIRKYYLNQMIRGLLYTIAFVSAYFLLIAFLENQFYFNTTIRKILFFSFLGAGLMTFLRWFIWPMTKYFKLGQTITNEKAAQIIGQHFPNVKDKLLNVIQLKNQADRLPESSLLIAGIEQKTNELQPVPFKSAIDLTKNKKYLRFALPPALLLIVLLFTGLISNPTKRLIQNNTEFEREAPFTFNIHNSKLEVPEFDNFDLDVSLTGQSLPAKVEILYDDKTFALVKDETGHFNFSFANVQEDVPFKLRAAGFESKTYQLNVLKKAGLISLSLFIDYPAYTGQVDETLEGTGDLVIPFGSKIHWQINTRQADDVLMKFDNTQLVQTHKKSNDQYEFLKTALIDQNYKVYLSNSLMPYSDSMAYSLKVIPDELPFISLEKYADSSNQKLVYLSGNVSDDYGISRLMMVQKIRSEDGKIRTRTVPIEKPAQKQGFYSYLFDIDDLKLDHGDELTYYFEVFDNDGIRGPKSTRTSEFAFKKPSIKELEKSLDESTKEIQSDLEKTLKEAKKVNEEIDKLKDKLLQQKSLSWQDREQFEKLVEKQKELQTKLDEAQEKMREKRETEEEIKEVSPEIKDKQDKLDKMLEEMKNPEEQNLLDKINELMDKLDKKESIEQLNQMSENQEQQNKNLERLTELLKQLELESKVQDQIDKLNKLAEQEEKLAKETEDQSKGQEDLKKEQSEIQKEFDEVKKKMDEIEKENKDLKIPKKLESQDDEQKSIDQDMKDSQEQLDKKQNKSAAGKQKSASKKMKDMAKNLQNDMEASAAEQIEMDMKAVRQLLENVLGLSFGQESLINEFNVTTINTPRYVSLLRDQNKVKTDFKMVDDSLQELSKRVYQLESFITEKVGDINKNLSSAMTFLEDREKPNAANDQQKAMTNLNDLALMLSEALENMQMQASQSMPGSQMCNKPGSNPGGKSGKKGKGGEQGTMPQMDKITEGQQKMNDAMKGQMQNMKNGKQPGSQGFGEMAAQQAKVRRALQDIDNQLRQSGQGNKHLQEIIDAMDQIEKDLVNKKLTNEMLLRQEKIMTKLLEEERAQREQEQDEKRKAESAETQVRQIPPSLKEYIRQREAGVDEVRPVYPALKPYYKRLVEQYYNQLSSGK